MFDVHRVVHHPVDISLVRASIRWVAMQDLAHRINSGSLAVPLPKVLFDMLDCVKTKSIDYFLSPQRPTELRIDVLTSVIANKILDPIIPDRPDLSLFRVKISQRDNIISQPAVLNLGLVVVVADLAVGVEVGGRVEGVEGGEVSRTTRAVVSLCNKVRLVDARQVEPNSLTI